MERIELTDYVIHRGDTGEGGGDGVALIWLGPTCEIPRDAVVTAAGGRPARLCIQGKELEIALLGFDPECYALAREKGLHVIWQARSGGVESFRIPPKF